MYYIYIYIYIFSFQHIYMQYIGAHKLPIARALLVDKGGPPKYQVGLILIWRGREIWKASGHHAAVAVVAAVAQHLLVYNHSSLGSLSFLATCTCCM